MYKNIIPFLLLVALLFMSCGTEGPSEAEIEKAVRISLEKRIPDSLVPRFPVVEDAIVDEVRIIEIGKPQGEGSHNYWPAKIYARGTCNKMFGGRRSFEREAEYYLSKNPWGEWEAEAKEFLKY